MHVWLRNSRKKVLVHSASSFENDPDDEEMIW